MKNNYLLEGFDSLAMQKSIQNIIKENNFLDASVSTYDMDEVPLEDALEDLDTYSFLTDKKVIIICSIENLKQEENKKDILHLYKYIDNCNPDNLLIVCAKKLNNSLKIVKELKKRLEYLKVSFNAIDFIKNELNGYQLEDGVVRSLADYCMEDITRLYNECNKLKLYRYDDKKIAKSDIEELVVRKLGDSTELIFAFARSLAEKNKKEALEKYQQLLIYKTEPLAIIGLLASQIRIIYQVKLLEKKRMSNDDMAKALNERSSYRIGKTRELTRYYSENELLKLMIALEDMDLKVKTSDVDPNFLLELFILNM